MDSKEGDGTRKSADDGGDEAAKKFKLTEELEKLKVATMYKMVDKIKTSVNDSQTEIDCLYLTNDQAMQVQIKNMPSVRKQLHLKEPNMVIRLMPAHFGTVFQKSFQHYYEEGEDGVIGGRFPTKAIPELEGDEEKTDHQLLLLAKDVLLPLASRTRALVIGTESCALTTAFLQVSGQVQRQLGEQCPFRLLIFARVQYYELSSQRPATVAYQVKRGSKGWTQAASANGQKAVLKHSYGDDEAYYPTEDLPTGRYSLIMFECASKGKPAYETYNNFTNDFITSLSERLPVIALQTFGTNKMQTVPALAEHVTRGLPLMLLDSRDRGGWGKSLEDAQEQLEDLSKALHKRGRMDQYYISAMAFLKGTLDRLPSDMSDGLGDDRKSGRKLVQAPAAAGAALAPSGDAAGALGLAASDGSGDASDEKALPLTGIPWAVEEGAAGAMAVTASTDATGAPSFPAPGGVAVKEEGLPAEARPLAMVSTGASSSFSQSSKSRTLRSQATRPMRGAPPADVGQLTDREMYIWQAIDRRLEDSSRKGGGEQGFGGTESQAQAARRKLQERRENVFKATNLLMRYVGAELEWESEEMMDRGEAAIKRVLNEGDVNDSWQQFKTRLEEDWCAIRGVSFHTFDSAKKALEGKKWIQLEKRKVTVKGMLVLTIVIDGRGNADCDLNAAKKELTDIFLKELEVCRAYNRRHKTRKAFCDKQDMWIAVYDILMEDPDIVHTGSIFDLKHVGRKITTLAHIDRLPPKNTLEALVLIRTAWNIVDVYNASARTYKWLSRLTYYWLLAVGLATVTFTVASNINEGSVSEEMQRYMLLGLALMASGLTGFTALVDPQCKWLQLRNSAYKMESEIWKFRTRVGEYQGNSTSTTVHGRQEDERRAERMLQDRILQIQGHVRLSTGLKETSFYSIAMATNDLVLGKDSQKNSAKLSRMRTLSNYILNPKAPAGSKEKERKLEKQHYLHEQYRRSKCKAARLSELQDSYHAPARPDEYIRWRLVPKMRFYEARIPGYAKKRRGFQGLLLFAALVTSLLAAIKEPHWTALVAAISSAVASAQEFLDLARKLQRYSSVSNALSNILVSWQALSEVEQANVEAVSQLVHQTESLLDEERNAWTSDVQVGPRLNKQSGDGKGGNGKAAAAAS